MLNNELSYIYKSSVSTFECGVFAGVRQAGLLEATT